jgi:hypothetical protein
MAVNRGWHYNLPVQQAISCPLQTKTTINPAGKCIRKRPGKNTRPAIQAEGAEFEGFPEHQIF